MSGPRIYGSCPYNEGIDCGRMICEHGQKCGWHPLIKRYRKQKIEKGEYNRCEKIIPPKTVERKPEKRDRGNYGSERIARLRAEGKCTICGKENDRPDKWCCTACYERKKALEKARNALINK